MCCLPTERGEAVDSSEHSLAIRANLSAYLSGLSSLGLMVMEIIQSLQMLKIFRPLADLLVGSYVLQSNER